MDENPTPTTTGDGFLDPGLAAGRSRLALFLGVGALAVGDMAGLPRLAWAGVGLAGLAFALNTAAKVLHYRALPLADRPRTILSASWILVAVAVLGLLVTYARARFGAGGGPFWTLAGVAVVFGLVHRLAQARFLPDDAGEAL